MCMMSFIELQKTSELSFECIISRLLLLYKMAALPKKLTRRFRLSIGNFCWAAGNIFTQHIARCKLRGWKPNNSISLIYYSIHFFLSFSLFHIQFCSIFIIPFQVCRVILYSECLNPKYSLFILFLKPLFIIPLPPPSKLEHHCRFGLKFNVPVDFLPLRSLLKLLVHKILLEWGG